MTITNSKYVRASTAVFPPVAPASFPSDPVDPDEPVDPRIAEFLASVSDIVATRDILYVLAGTSENSFKINLADPDLYTLTAVGNPIFEPFQGVTGSVGQVDYFDTGYIPDRGHLQILDAEIDVFVCDNTYDPDNGSMLEYGNSYNQIKALETQLILGSPTTVGARITRNATQRTANGVVTNAIGLVSVARHATGLGVRIYKNAVQIGGGGGAAIGVGTDTFKIGINSVRRLGFCSAGSRIADADRTRWYNAINTLMLQLGAYDPEDLNLPPVPGGPDPYAPPADTVWTESAKGTPLNMTGLHLTHDSTFDTQQKLDAICTTGGPGPWFAPIHSTVGFANFVPPNAPVPPFSIQNGVLRIRMEKVLDIWQTGHMQTADFNGNGFSQTMGYFECKMKMPPAGTKGAWPAFWLYGRGLYTAPSETRPEIDVIEYYPGNDSRGYHCAVHLRPGSPYIIGQVSRHWYKSDYIGMDAIRDGNWHLYGVEVTYDWIIIYMDRVEVIRIKCLPEQRVPLYMLVSLQGLGSEKDQAVSPIDLFVEYVRAYQRS